MMQVSGIKVSAHIMGTAHHRSGQNKTIWWNGPRPYPSHFRTGLQ